MLQAGYLRVTRLQVKTELISTARPDATPELIAVYQRLAQGFGIQEE